MPSLSRAETTEFLNRGLNSRNCNFTITNEQFNMDSLTENLHHMESPFFITLFIEPMMDDNLNATACIINILSI